MKDDTPLRVLLITLTLLFLLSIMPAPAAEQPRGEAPCADELAAGTRSEDPDPTVRRQSPDTPDHHDLPLEAEAVL